MKTLVVYASKYGHVKDCVEKLRNQLTGLVRVVDVSQGDTYPIKEYSNVIIGSSVYMGFVNKQIKSYIKKNFDELMNKNIGLFLCCAFTDNFDKSLTQAFPSELIAKAKSIECFGGELRKEKMGFLHKKIYQALEKETNIIKIKTIPENIKNMALKFNTERR